MINVSCGVLKSNGLRFYTQFDPSSNVSGIGVKCGSIHDPPGMSGLAHLVEHMLCRESSLYSNRAVDLVMEKYMGGPDADINVRIDRVSTFYGHDALLYQRHMLQCFNMMASILKDKIVNIEGLQIEAAAIHNEYYLYGIDTMPNLVDDLMHEHMYEKNPARKRIDCQVEDLRKISLTRARQFIKKHYVSGNMFVVLLGPSFNDSKKMVERMFGDMPPGNPPILDYDFSDSFNVLSAPKFIEVERPGIHQYHLGLGFPTEAYSSKDSQAIDVLARILAFRLRMRLREGNRDFDKGVYRALCFAPRTFAHGMIYAWTATTSPDFAKEAEEIMADECRKLKEDLVSDDEMDAMTSNLLYNYLEAFIKLPGSLSEMIIDSACNGDEDLVGLHSFRQNLKKVTRRKLRDVANKYFTLPNYLRVLIKPA